jgi:hypothetical protein
MERSLILVVSIIATGCMLKDPATPDASAIEGKLKTYYNDMSDRNWTAYQSHFWPGATITTVWTGPQNFVPAVDITSIEDFIKETPNGPDSQPIFEETMENSQITFKANIAEAWVNYNAKFGETR